MGALSVALSLVSALAAAAINFDSWHEEIHAAARWTYDSCRTWSGGLVAAGFATGAGGAALGSIRRVSRLGTWIGAAAAAYWVVVLLFGRGSCVSGIE